MLSFLYFKTTTTAKWTNELGLGYNKYRTTVTFAERCWRKWWVRLWQSEEEVMESCGAKKCNSEQSQLLWCASLQWDVTPLSESSGSNVFWDLVFSFMSFHEVTTYEPTTQKHTPWFTMRERFIVHLKCRLGHPTAVSSIFYWLPALPQKSWEFWDKSFVGFSFVFSGITGRVGLFWVLAGIWICQKI